MSGRIVLGEIDPDLPPGVLRDRIRAADDRVTGVVDLLTRTPIVEPLHDLCLLAVVLCDVGRCGKNSGEVWGLPGGELLYRSIIVWPNDRLREWRARRGPKRGFDRPHGTLVRDLLNVDRGDPDHPPLLAGCVRVHGPWRLDGDRLEAEASRERRPSGAPHDVPVSAVLTFA